MPPFILRSDWYTEVTLQTGDSPNRVNPNLPGLYEWRIEGVGVYIGQYTNPSRPRKEYERNLRNKGSHKNYRLGKPNFRPIHESLFEWIDKAKITLTFLENVDSKSERNRREREVIQERRISEANGGLRVLNGRRRIDSAKTA